MIGPTAREMMTTAIAALDEDIEITVAGVWADELRRAGSPNPTAAAFTASGGMLTNVVILDPDANPHAQANEVPSAAFDSLIVWFYAHDSVKGRADIDILRTLTYGLFRDDAGFGITLEDGSVAFPAWAGGMATRANHEEFPNSVYGCERFRVSYTRV